MKRKTAAALVVGVSLIAILLVGVAPTWAATAATTYDNVQIFVQTTNPTFMGTFTVTAYNSTGYALVTYNTAYPAASFELPSASYIFTVNAVSQGLYVCPLMTPASTPTTSTQATSSTSSTSTVVLPPCQPGSKSEYGFAAQQISGPVSITISTMSYQDLPTTTVTVHAQYVNGTAAPHANVVASILGGQGYGIFGPTPVNMSGVTGANGNAKLVVPAVPLQITASKWVVVKATSGQNPGVLTVSATRSRGPIYEILTGSTILVPPQTTATIVLHSEQSVYPPGPLYARR